MVSWCGLKFTLFHTPAVRDLGLYVPLITFLELCSAHRADDQGKKMRVKCLFSCLGLDYECKSLIPAD